MSYYSCTGSVTSGNGSNSQALTCSTGWQTYTPPEQQTNTLEFTGQLVTLEQGRELFTALALLFITIAVFRALSRIG